MVTLRGQGRHRRWRPQYGSRHTSLCAKYSRRITHTLTDELQSYDGRLAARVALIVSRLLHTHTQHVRYRSVRNSCQRSGARLSSSQHSLLEYHVVDMSPEGGPLTLGSALASDSRIEKGLQRMSTSLWSGILERRFESPVRGNGSRVRVEKLVREKLKRIEMVASRSSY